VPYTYNCPPCGTKSRSYTFRSGAEGHGVRHRNRRHDGDYPVGESIQHITRFSPLTRAFAWHPSKGDVIAAAVAVLLVLWSVWHALTN
jgi:hypothetical protein